MTGAWTEPPQAAVKFGLSGWAYDEWQAFAQPGVPSEERFKEDCLAEYARYRYRGQALFRTVGIEHTYCCPPSDAQLNSYFEQVPDGFEICSKVWEEITIPWYPNLPQYGAKAGRVNTDFLNVKLFQDEVLGPYRRTFTEHVGPFILEFQQAGMMMRDFLPRLDEFLKRLPKDFRYAIEMKNEELLGPAYADILKAHGAAHVLAHCSSMPSLLEQHSRLAGRFAAPFVVLKLMTPRARRFSHGMVRPGESDRRIMRSLPRMRKETVWLIRQAVAEGRRVYVLVHNRLEGSAPQTIQALTDLLSSPVADRAAVQSQPG